MSLTKSKLEQNLRRVNKNIAAACAIARRDPAEVTLVAVTKTAGIEQINWLLELGVHELGESRVQQLTERSAQIAETLQKRPELGPARWHMIGHLQRNKVRQVLDSGTAVIHSVDSLRLAEEISERAGKSGRTVDVLLEINCSQESQKLGVAVGAASYLAEMITTLKSLRLVGLMTMAAQTDKPQETRPTFVRLRELFEEMRHEGIGAPPSATCRWA